jgi:excisionase family DNA binding protein
MSMSSVEASRWLGVNIETVQRLCRAGKLYAYKRGRDWWIDAQSVKDRMAPGERHAGGRPNKEVENV